MLFSKTANILTFVGWESIASFPIVYDIIGLDLAREIIAEIPSTDFNAKIVRCPSYLNLTDQYINTNTGPESTIESKRLLVSYTKTDSYPEFANMTKDEVYLLGIILTDSYFGKYGEIEIYQSMKKSHVVDRINVVLEALNVKGALYERERGGKHYTWRIKKDVADIIKGRFELQDRGNPSVMLLFMPYDSRMQLLLAMMDGDGTWNNPQHDYGIFYKPQIIDFFQLLAMSLGYRSKTNSHRKQIYISKVGFEDKQNWIEPEATLVKQKIELVEIKPKEDVVFSPIIMDNGKIFFGKI